MKPVAPQFIALISILRTGGPVISTLLSSISLGVGAHFHEAFLIQAVSGKKSGKIPYTTKISTKHSLNDNIATYLIQLQLSLLPEEKKMCPGFIKPSV